MKDEIRQPNSRTLRVGVVGTGFGLTGHLPAWRSTPGAEVTAICSEQRGRAAAIAAEHRIARGFDSVEQLVGHDEVDLVVVANAPRDHGRAVRAALAAGKPVLCEKPFTLDAAEARALAAEAEAAGVATFLNFEIRCDPVIEAAVEQLRAGAVGELRQVTATHFAPYVTGVPHLIGGWWFDRAQGGGWLFAHGAHYIDLLHLFFGPEARAVSVSARLYADAPEPVTRDGPRRSNVDDGYALEMAFAGGGRASVISSGATAAPSPRRIELHGSRGRLLIDDDRLSLATPDGRSRSFDIEKPEPFEGDMHIPLLRRWTARITAALRAGERLPVDFAQGLRVQAVLDAALRSSDEGRRVAVE